MKRWIWIVAFLALSLEVDAQNLKIFEDGLGVKGEYRFSGEYQDTVLPRQGPVEIRWRELSGGYLKTYRVKGQTRDHLPTGRWIWEEAQWDYKVSAGASIVPLFEAKGERMKWEGAFVAGKPDGKWMFNVDSISGSGKPVSYLIKVEMAFKNGKPSGAFSLTDNTGSYALRVKGMCDTTGVAAGTWNYTYKNEQGVLVKEEREYKQGLLTAVKRTEGTNKSELNFESNSRFIQNGNYLASVNGSRIGDLSFGQDEYGGIASELYHENLSQYFQRGWKLGVFPYAFDRFIPSFRRLEHPLNEKEIRDLANSRRLISGQKDTIEQLLSGNISIHRSRSGELDTTISYLQLQLLRLNYLDSLLDRVELPFFTYKNRYGMDSRNWIEGLNRFRYAKGQVYDSLRVELPLIELAGDSVYFFREIYHILSRNEAELPRYFQEVENAHISVKQEGELQELENKIAERFAEQQLFYEDKEGIGALIRTKWVRGEVQHLIQEYARSDEYETALSIGSEVLVKLDSLESWQSKIELFDRMPELLKSSYTYLVYNPYTGENSIAVTNKKRFLNAVLTNLWPYLLNEIREESEWAAWCELWERQFTVFNYLVDFAAKDDAHAKRIDKRVRKEKKPEKMLKILLQQ